MGIRIHFYKNNFSTGLKNLILENYSDYAEWYLNKNKSSVEEFNEIYGTKELIDFFSKNRSIENDLSLIDKKLVDEMTAEFVLEYSEFNGCLDFFGPSMGKWRYQESTNLVLKTKNEEFIKLWKYLTQGRSLINSGKFDSYTNDYKIGYLSLKEHQILKEMIGEYFGDLNDMREKYWTNSEKRKLEIAQQNPRNGVYSLSDHNPITSGLEFVVLALNEMKTIEAELITGIEQDYS